MDAKLIQIHTLSFPRKNLQPKKSMQISTKLEKAKSAGRVFEKELFSSIDTLQDTAAKWQDEMKMCCNTCQSLDNERIDFLRTSLWHMTNVISTNCVFDDECSEKMRCSLETCQAKKDIEFFINNYATGTTVPGMFKDLCH
jgi:hypothetical protein